MYRQWLKFIAPLAYLAEHTRSRLVSPTLESGEREFRKHTALSPGSRTPGVSWRLRDTTPYEVLSLSCIT